MKSRLVLCIGCVGFLLLGSSVSFACRGGCASANVSPCAEQVASASSNTKPNCSCSDPGCYASDLCVSGSQCCELFGNIGQVESRSSCDDY